ncbi:MAG: hypothetical protein IT314_06730 [Anaerolineales bacterium]|nr:hypothetical protein [Anaerolineales bacterium]
MKNKDLEPDEDGMLPEYDFTGKNIVRGKHYRAMQKGYTVRINNEDGTTTVRHYGPTITLDTDVSAYFPDSESVNKALRSLIALIPDNRLGEKKGRYTVRKKSGSRK